MNILLTNDDGSSAYGLQVLRDAAKKQWRHAKTVVLVPKADQTGAGMGVKTGAVEKLKPQKQGPGFFVVPSATPADIVNLAFVRSDLFLPAEQRFDLVISGVNHGANVGWSVLASGTVGAAMLAAFHYGACGWAFSQAFGPCGARSLKPKGDVATRKAFANAVRYLTHFFENQKPMPGECMNVNFPYQQPATKGWIQCLVAPFDPYIGDRFTPLSMRDKSHDVDCLNAGFITRSPVVLGYNPPLNW